MTPPKPGLNGTVPPGDWTAHIGHRLHPHYHPVAGKTPKECSGRWYCEKDRAWITGIKCGDTGKISPPQLDTGSSAQ